MNAYIKRLLLVYLMSSLALLTLIIIPYLRNYIKNSMKEYIPYKWKEICKHYFDKLKLIESEKNKYFFKLQEIKNHFIKSNSFFF